MAVIVVVVVVVFVAVAVAGRLCFVPEPLQCSLGLLLAPLLVLPGVFRQGCPSLRVALSQVGRFCLRLCGCRCGSGGRELGAQLLGFGVCPSDGSPRGLSGCLRCRRLGG